MNPTLKQVQDDWRTLHVEDFEFSPSVRVVTNFSDLSNDEIKAQCIKPNRFVRLFPKFSLLYNLFYAIQIIYLSDKKSVVAMDGSHGNIWLFAGYVNRLLGRNKRVMVFIDCFIEYHFIKERRLRFFPFVKFTAKRKIALTRGALLGYNLITVWSKKQIIPHAKMYDLPEKLFCFIPYKAKNSKQWRLYPETSETTDAPASTEQKQRGCYTSLDKTRYYPSIGSFIYSAGNGKRDYPCLIEAVRDTGIPVIISATHQSVRKELEQLPNVIILGAYEPAYSQLIAASQFTVLPMIDSGVKGGGEGFMCDSMWYSKAVIACCNIAAEDYIINGETGYVVSVGDSETLRKRILELWNNPEKCKEMERKGREHCEKWFTHEHWVRRCLRLLSIMFDEYDTQQTEK